MLILETKVATNSAQKTVQPIKVDSNDVEVLLPGGCIKHLGREFCFSEYHATELRHRINRGWGVFHQYKSESCTKRLPSQKRLKLFDAVVTSTVLYGCVSWTLTKGECVGPSNIECCSGCRGECKPFSAGCSGNWVHDVCPGSSSQVSGRPLSSIRSSQTE